MLGQKLCSLRYCLVTKTYLFGTNLCNKSVTIAKKLCQTFINIHLQ